jgi:uncharacterized protein (DUF362 family)
MLRKTDRREFLKGGLAIASTLVTAGAMDVLSPLVACAQQSPDLVVSRANIPWLKRQQEYWEGSASVELKITGPGPESPVIAAMTRSAVDALGGMSKFVKPGNKVVVKPNMSFGRIPEDAANTHPAVVAEVCKMCVEAGASRISVLDYVLHDPQECLKMSKIPEYCQNIDKTVVSTIQGRRRFREVKVPLGRMVKSMEVETEVLDSDVLIAVPVAKSHAAAGVSLSMKGMMGLIYDRHSFHTRHELHQAIADMVTVIRPKLVVVDGTRIMTTGGPGGPGKVIPGNLVIASSDMVAADAQMVALGTWFDKKFQPDQVRHIKLAAEQGLGQIDLSKVNIKEVQG